MGYTYILQSTPSGRFYIGSTDNLERRLGEHNSGKSLATRNRGPWKLVYSRQFPALTEVRQHELEIKKWKSSKMIRALIESPVR